MPYGPGGILYHASSSFGFRKSGNRASSNQVDSAFSLIWVPGKIYSELIVEKISYCALIAQGILQDACVFSAKRNMVQFGIDVDAERVCLFEFCCVFI